MILFFNSWKHFKLSSQALEHSRARIKRSFYQFLLLAKIQTPSIQ